MLRRHHFRKLSRADGRLSQAYARLQHYLALIAVRLRAHQVTMAFVTVMMLMLGFAEAGKVQLRQPGMATTMAGLRLN